jgi:hypothetical protein
MEMKRGEKMIKGELKSDYVFYSGYFHPSTCHSPIMSNIHIDIMSASSLVKQSTMFKRYDVYQ